MQVEYDTWVFDGWASLPIPSSDPQEVGELIGEMAWCVWLEVHEAGAPAIDYEQALQPKQPLGSTVQSLPRGIVAAERLQTLRGLTERALAGLREDVRLGWIHRRLRRLWDASTGSWEPLTYKAIAKEMGRDRATIRRWVAQGDERLCLELDKMGWEL